MQKNQQPGEATGEVGERTLNLVLSIEGADREVGLRRDTAWLAYEWRADDPVWVGVLVTGSWGGATGDYLIAGGSHAGNVDGQKGYRDYPSYAPASKILLVPLESIRGQAMSRAARFDPITPPWEKEVWRDPEAEGTG